MRELHFIQILKTHLRARSSREFRTLYKIQKPTLYKFEKPTLYKIVRHINLRGKCTLCLTFYTNSGKLTIQGDALWDFQRNLKRLLKRKSGL